MFKKIGRAVGKAFLTALNRISCKTYKRLYPNFLRWGGVAIEKNFQEGGYDPWIAPSAWFDPGYPELIRIGRGTTISFDACFLAHDYSIDKELFARTGKHGLLLGRVEVGGHCFIGARAMLLPGTSLGDGCVVGAQAVVKGAYPAGSILAGNPARVVGNVQDQLDRHLAKGDISYWRGAAFDEFEPHVPDAERAFGASA